MGTLQVALLNASYNDSMTTENFRRDVDADVRPFAVNKGHRPETFEYDAVIVSGSGASVYWDEPWIEPLADWVGGAIERDVPVLGVCFGHQLVAHALGGDVSPMGEYELGYREVEVEDSSVLFDGLPDRFVAFTTHSDEVTALPPDATVIAANECSIQGFRRGHAFGVQFHPEYDRASAERVTRNKDLPDERIRGVLDGITDETVDAATDAKTVFDNFLGYARRRTETDR
ncbi:type 1 glutamine amidotransferase [Natronococcus wangiae]|uniref:type 1 glutamine amidotransferase n=1 Tax=Natronococcus wangiae TaxID=3068275 RepID=UPI00273D8A3A|nr:type 1 glutamine amidotransferase [Natronococcus sp. AD5]